MRVTILLLCFALLAAACGDSGTDTTTTTSSAVTTSAAETTTTVAETTTTAAADTTTTVAAGSDTTTGAVPESDITIIEFAELGSEAVIEIPIIDVDASFLLSLRTEGPDDFVVIESIVGPDGVDLGKETGVDLGEGIIGDGELSVLMPASPAVELVPGDYAVSVASDGEIVGATAIIKRAPAANQVIDVTIWNAATQIDDLAAAIAELEAVGAEVLNPHGLGIGELSVTTAPADIVGEYSQLELDSNDFIDSNQRALCAEMMAEFGATRTLHLVLVDAIVDPSDDEGITEGNSTGIPGAILSPDAASSCVVMTAGPDPFEPERDLIARANVAWHEMGHFLGLFHTTEEDGQSFDIIDDTPECPVDEFDDDGNDIVTADECPDGDLMMFYDSDALNITPDQAFVLAHHPLFRP